MYKNVFLYKKTHRHLKNDYQFFDTLKTKDRKIRGNSNLLIKSKFCELERSSPLTALCMTSVYFHFFLCLSIISSLCIFYNRGARLALACLDTPLWWWHLVNET